MLGQNRIIVRTIYIFTIVALAGSIFVFISAIISLKRLEISGIAGLAGVVGCLLILGLLQQKHTLIPRILIPLIVFGIGTYLIANVSVHDEALLLYPLAISLAGLFLGRKGIVVFGVLTVLSTTSVALTQLSPTTNLNTIVVLCILTGLSALMMYVLVNMLNENFERISQDQDLLTEANRQLELSHASLENKVKERTLAAENARADAETARSAAEAARSSLENQIWLAIGQARLAEVMREAQNIQQLAGNVISELCRYSDAQAGALYLLEDKSLSMVGRYAFNTRPGFDGKVQIGTGLIGQAAANGKMICLNDIPTETVIISTGLVDIHPRQLIAYPFQAKSELLGVIEMATLSIFTPAHFELFERTSESIGIAFRTEQTRQRLAGLLMETQLQAEELQAQEEELRSANEELNAQAENLKSMSEVRAWKDAA